MVGAIQGMSGASGYMPKVSATPQNSDNIFNSIISTTPQETQKASSAMGPEEMLKMLTENTSSPMSNISSNELLSFLQNSTQTNNSNNTNSLMNNILSAYSNDSTDKKSYTALA